MSCEIRGSASLTGSGSSSNAIKYLDQFVALYPVAFGYAAEHYAIPPKTGAGAGWRHTVIYRVYSARKHAIANIVSRPIRLGGELVWEIVTAERVCL